MKAKIVEPGYGPTTSFTANSSERMRGLLPEAYGSYAEQLLRGHAAAKNTSELDVAKAAWLAATDGSPRLRYPAGPDADPRIGETFRANAEARQLARSRVERVG